jgi:integrase
LAAGQKYLSTSRKEGAVASITREFKGRRLLQFIARDGKRKSIRLGKVSQRLAEEVKIKVEALNSAAISGHAVDDEVARWLVKLDHIMVEKLAAVGLVPRREAAILGSFINRYIEGRHGAKPRTIELLREVEKKLNDFFGSVKPMRDITPGDAEEWRLHLVKIGLGDNTIRRRCGIAKQFFNAAIRLRLIAENPFHELKSTVQANASRFYFVTLEEAGKVLENCPDAEWRLIFALGRFGGMRCPSEHFALKWTDVDWEQGRITVHSPKTEHHPGKDSRTIPLFPELRPFLEEAFDLAPEGAVYVIARYRDTNQNLRTQLERIIRRAGLKPWPKLFVNLRSTRETELAESFPMHVVCEWIGNSQPVAMKHYLQITDDHFARALGRAAKSDAPVVQNPVQQPAARSCIESQNPTQDQSGCGLALVDAETCENVRDDQIRPAGLEPATYGSEDHCSVQLSYGRGWR